MSHDCSLVHPGTVCSAGGGIRSYSDARPAPSPAAEPPEGLREAQRLSNEVYLLLPDAANLLTFEEEQALQITIAAALAPLLDRAAKAEAAVERARALLVKAERDEAASIQRMFDGRPFPVSISQADLRRALDD